MGATSVTGTSGVGESKKLTTKELSIMANAPSIIFTGTIETVDAVGSTSPPLGNIANVIFPYPLEGDHSKYVVLLTTISGGFGQVTDFEDTDNGFEGFTIYTEAECTTMYLVAKIGSKPKIV